MRKKAGRPAFAKASLDYAPFGFAQGKRDKSAGGVMTVAEVQELLAEALGDLRAGRIKPGEAYAVGYLAQLALTAIGAARKARKLDVKHFWEVVELGAAIETAEEMQKEKEKEKEAEEAGPTEPQMNADERGSQTVEAEDDSEEEGVLS